MGRRATGGEEAPGAATSPAKAERTEVKGSGGVGVNENSRQGAASELGTAGATLPRGKPRLEEADGPPGSPGARAGRLGGKPTARPGRPPGLGSCSAPGPPQPLSS